MVGSQYLPSLVLISLITLDGHVPSANIATKPLFTEVLLLAVVAGDTVVAHKLAIFFASKSAPNDHELII